MAANAKLNAESFIQLVKQSNLVDAKLLESTWKELQGQQLDLSDARVIAEEMVGRNVLTSWQADKLLKRKHKGFFLGKYRLLSHLGSGGMSAVYLAEHVLMRRRVAIKVLPQARVEDSSYLQRFHREAQAVAALDHRNIVRAYDVDQEGEVHFLVMEYVPGLSLHDLVTTREPLDYVRAAEYTRQAADGLHHAHRAGMVHRDIKPGNLLLDEKGIVKLLDLGLARFFGDKDETSLTIQHNEKVLGTADFLSPEQALDSHKVDTRSDIYSLGCTLYFLLTGHPPFPDGTLAQRLLAHQTKLPEPIRTERPDIPESFVTIIDKMMAKKLDERYQTARDVSTALLQWLMQNGGEVWSQMNPVVAGGHLPNVASAAPRGTSPSDVLTIEAVPPTGKLGARPSTTDIGRSATLVPGVRQPVGPAADSALPSGLGEPARAESVAEPELAAFLSNLSAQQGDPSAPPDEKKETPRPTNEKKPPRPAAKSPLQTETAVQAAPPNRAVKKTVPQPTAGERPQSAVRQDAEKAVQQDLKPLPVASRIGANASGDKPANRPAAVSVRGEANIPPPASPPSTGPRANSGGKKNIPAGSPAASAGSDSPPADFPILPWYRNRRLIIAVASGAALLVIAMGFFAFRGDQPAESTTHSNQASDKPAAGQKAASAKRTASVRREFTVGSGKEFSSIAAALAEATQSVDTGRRSARTIKVAGGQTFAERLVIDDTYPRGIQIVAADDGPPPILAPLGTDPVLIIRGGQEGVRNFRFEGFQIEAGGKEFAIRVEGWAPGTRLSRLRINGFNRAGVLIDGVQTYSAENDRVTIANVTFRGSGSEAVGVQFQKQADDPVHVRIEQCRFFGPLTAGVLFDCGVFDIEVMESIFFRTTTGVRFAGTGRSWRDVLLAYNTFYENERALVFTNMPGADSRGFGFFNNLFVGSRQSDAVVEHDLNVTAFLSMYRTSPGGADYNWTTRPRSDPPAPEDFIALFETLRSRFAAQDVQFVSVDPESPELLAPMPGSPQHTVGSAFTGRKFGRQVGAVRGQ